MTSVIGFIAGRVSRRVVSSLTGGLTFSEEMRAAAPEWPLFLVLFKSGPTFHSPKGTSGDAHGCESQPDVPGQRHWRTRDEKGPLRIAQKASLCGRVAVGHGQPPVPRFMALLCA